MNKYLLFRTDRIGDFLLSAILINSIKKNDIHAHITVIASKKNYNYIKNFKLVDEVILFKNSFIDRIKLIFKLKKNNYQNIILHDGKKRSYIISFFLKAKIKVYVKNSPDLSHIEIIKNILKKFNFKFQDSYLNILTIRNKNNFKLNNFIQLHFDEKWIYNDYIKEFVNIEPLKNELLSFLKSIILKTNKKLVITTGLVAPKIIDGILLNNKDKNIIYFKNLDFLRLEDIIVNSYTLISCHGAVSHIATAKEIKQIDIIDSSYLYGRWTNHFRNYNYVYREKFKDLSQKILKKLEIYD